MVENNQEALFDEAPMKEEIQTDTAQKELWCMLIITKWINNIHISGRLN